MIPILYTPYEVDFTSNGVGRLNDCVSCIVTEERNGIYECEFVYPITGKFYHEMITSGGCVAVFHDDNHDVQPFDIYKHTAPINGLVTFYAHHISYRLNNILVRPFTADNVVECFTKIIAFSVGRNPFTFTTDKITTAPFAVNRPDAIRAILGGQQGSVLDAFGGGEYKWDKFNVYLYQNRGVDSNVTIRHGKNLTDLTHDIDETGTYSAIAPFWEGPEGNVVYLPEVYVTPDDVPIKSAPWTDKSGNYITDGNGEIIYFQHENVVPIPVDFSNQFPSEPSAEELRQVAKSFLENNKPWIPNENITVDFVALWQTPEYENVAALQKLGLCDTVSVFYPELGVIASGAKIIKVVYNVLNECFDRMEIGKLQTTLAEVITTGIESLIADLPSKSVMQAAIEHATQLITGGLGGHVVFTLNQDGEPEEILIMDTDDIDTAVHVIRMNLNGIGFSNNGYLGPYETAWTIDGAFVADFITSGTMLADRIKGGTLEVGGIDDQDGVISILNSSGTKRGELTKNGLTTISMHGENESIYDYEFAFWGAGINIKAKTGSSTRTAFELKPSSFTDNPALASKIDSVLLFSRAYGSQARFLYGCGLIPSIYQLIINESTLLQQELRVQGDFSCDGTKSRRASAGEFGERLLYSYETPSPMFGDVGEGVIDETGLCYVFLDAVFAETITTSQYQVFLQRYGEGDCYVAERNPDCFVVKGEPGLSFGWELKAKQKDFDQLRLEFEHETMPEPHNYGEEGNEFYEKLKEGRIA